MSGFAARTTQSRLLKSWARLSHFGTRKIAGSLQLLVASFAMTPEDFRRIALSLEGTEESSHMGQPDFRVSGRIFATLAAQKQGYGNLMLSPEQQATFVEELPDVFIPIPGGWGRMGATHIVLAKANMDVLSGALEAAWRLRKEKNAKVRKKTSPKNPGAKRTRRER